MSDPVGVRTWAEAVSALLGRLEGVERSLGRGRGRDRGLGDDSWVGQARRAYDVAVAGGVREREAWAATLRWVAPVLFAYADEVTALRGELAEAWADDPAGDEVTAVRGRLDAAGRALAGVLTRAVDVPAREDDVEVRERSRALGMADVAAQGGGPDDVADWWHGLPPERRAALAVALAPVLGSAAGLPAAVRDRGNRAALRTDLAAVGRRSRDGHGDGADATRLRNARAVHRALQVPAGDAPTTLWRYDPSAYGGDGVVAVGVGDLDGADDLAVLVPGVGTEVDDVGGQVARVRRLVDKTSDNGRGAPAGVFWLGYDSPDHPGDPAMFSPARAREGADALRDDVDALAAGREGAGGGEGWRRVTVLGHSYGSTVVAEAGTRGLDADAVALLGSPGAGSARTADDLGVREVYVARDSRDAVARLGDEGAWGGPGLGVDPSSEEFRAVRLRAERPGRGPTPWLGEAHSGYLEEGSESLRNLRRVVVGDAGRIEPAERSADRWWFGPRDPEWGRDVG